MRMLKAFGIVEVRPKIGATIVWTDPFRVIGPSDDGEGRNRPRSVEADERVGSRKLQAETLQFFLESLLRMSLFKLC